MNTPLRQLVPARASLSRRLAFSALCLGAASAATSCADNDSSMYVAGVMVQKGSGCTVTKDPSATQLYRGTLDVAFAQDYKAAVLVANQLTPRGKKNQLRTETQGVVLEGAEISLTDAEGAVLDEYTVPVGGFVNVNSSEQPGYGLAMVTMIPPSRGDAMLSELQDIGRGASRTLISNVRVYGTTLGGIDLTSGAFTFPIDVCYGCLVQFPLEAVVSDGDGNRVCSGQPDNAGENVCNLGQDDLIDCRLCASTLDICQSVD